MSSLVRSTDHGQALVEFALAAPVLLLLLIGIVDVGLMINTSVTVTDASREGATYATTHMDAPLSSITSAATGRLSPLVPANATVTVNWYDSGSSSPNASWPASTGSPTRPVAVQVEVSYPWSASTILVGQIIGSRTFHGTSTMVVTR